MKHRLVMLFVMGITLLTLTATAGLIDQIKTDKTSPSLVPISGTNSSVFDLIPKDNLSTKNAVLIIQGLDDIQGLPNTTYDWFLADPAPLISIG